MKDYNKLSKEELVVLLQEISSVTKKSIQRAKEKSLKYSNDINSQTAFECGYLIGTIKNVNSILEVED